MNWEEIENFCEDCLMKNENICICDDIIEHFKNSKYETNKQSNFINRTF